MDKPTLLLLILVLTTAGYYFGRKRSLDIVSGKVQELHSLPSYYGYYLAMWVGVPTLLLLLIWLGFEGAVLSRLVVADLPGELQGDSGERAALLINEIRNTMAGAGSGSGDPSIQAAANHYRHLQAVSDWLLSLGVIALAALGGWFGHRQIEVEQRARNKVEKGTMVFLIACSTIAIFTTVGIVLSVVFESVLFFQKVPVTDFLFGLRWSPQMAIRADQVGSSGAFGAVPLFTGTLLISFIAMVVAVPIGLMSAIYLAEYASPRVRTVAKPLLEILAGVPTVVYGFFAALTVAPYIRDLGQSLGLDVSSESALAAGLVMGVMIIPFVSSLSDDFINAVPQSLRDGAYALGATQSETIRQVIIPAALPGIVGGILLAVSRAIGETMIVVMAAGLSANLTANPLAAVTTVTTQIVTLLVGDQEFDSPKTLAAFALGLVLFLVTLMLNIAALMIVRKYREQYE
ncbi:phosphate ABC transporter permease subunit PstC [Methylotetracoccus oryzae]|uniref:phosphate ABC transporter permease subunit PstC n=1 Tax=Methylotetracoccus oryzae TaxID=1919059 RepID=UPI0011192490|nr:phosphate ABC transporter permease subunit PstC [Methylotetracoccus oryzae]